MPILRSLSHRNYRLYFFGQGISLMGTWVQIMAMSWLVYRLTVSPFMLGTVSFCSQIPSLLFGPLAGLLSDQISRHKIVIITQVLAMLQAAVLAALVITNTVEIWHLFFLSLFLGCVNAFDMPTRQSFVIDLLEDRNDLNNAIALNSLMVNIGRLVGPTVAGILISWVGEGMCFLLNAASFIAVLAALLAMKINPANIKSGKSKTGLQSLQEGYRYAFNTPPIKYMITLMSIISICALSFPVLMPIFAGEIFAGGASTLGYLMAAIGVGAISGGFFLAANNNVACLYRVIPAALLLLGASLTAFSQSTSLVAALIILFFAGLGMMLFISTTNTMLQTVVEDDKRGRIMSLYTMSFLGMAPFGSFLAGSLAHNIGTPETVLIGGIVCMLCSAVFFLRIPYLRPYFLSLPKR